MHSKLVSQHPPVTVGEPTLYYAEVLRKLQYNCARRKDPNIIYLTVDIRNESHSEWGFNTPKHFTRQELTTEALIGLIHPVWRDINLSFRAENYLVLADILAAGEIHAARFQFNLPLRRKDNKYYWFKQVVYPVTYDQHGNVVHFMKELRLITEFDKLAPEMPGIYLGSTLAYDYTRRVQRAGEKAFVQSFGHLVSDAGFKLLDCYRRRSVYHDHQWIAPKKEVVERELGLSRTALNKAIVRLMGRVKLAVPAIATDSIGDFSGFLNSFFGPPA